MLVIGFQQLVAQSQAPAQFDTPSGSRDKVVRPAFDQVTVFPHGLQHAAQTRGGLQQEQLGIGDQFVQTVRGRQAGDSSSDDSDSFRGSG